MFAPMYLYASMLSNNNLCHEARHECEKCDEYDRVGAVLDVSENPSNGGPCFISENVSGYLVC